MGWSAPTPSGGCGASTGDTEALRRGGPPTVRIRAPVGVRLLTAGAQAVPVGNVEWPAEAAELRDPEAVPIRQRPEHAEPLGGEVGPEAGVPQSGPQG